MSRGLRGPVKGKTTTKGCDACAPARRKGGNSSRLEISRKRLRHARCPRRNRPSRVHHELQIKRFLAHSQVIVKHRRSNSKNGTDQNLPNKFTHVTQGRPQTQGFGIFGRERNGDAEGKCKKKRCRVSEDKIKQIDHESPPGIVLRQPPTPFKRTSRPEILQKRGRHASKQPASHVNPGNDQKDEGKPHRKSIKQDDSEQA